MDERDELDIVIEAAENCTAADWPAGKRDAKWRDIDAARAIRDRERKLAGLAHEARRYYGVFARRARVWGREPAPDVTDWLKRYEEAVK